MYYVSPPHEYCEIVVCIGLLYQADFQNFSVLKAA